MPEEYLACKTCGSRDHFTSEHYADAAWPDAGKKAVTPDEIRYHRYAHWFAIWLGAEFEFKDGGSTMSEREDRITLTNVTNKIIQTDTLELGQAIHAEALQREKEARQDAVISEVQRLESARLEYAQKAVFATNASNWYAAKLEAVKTGEFKFDLVHGLMLFNDPDFQRANF
jgi:hypothetical protein